MTVSGVIFLLTFATVAAARHAAPAVKSTVKTVLRRPSWPGWLTRHGTHRAGGRPMLVNIQGGWPFHREPTWVDDLDPKYWQRRQLEQGELT